MAHAVTPVLRVAMAWAAAGLAIANLVLVLIGLYVRGGRWSSAMAWFAAMLGSLVLLLFTQTATAPSTRRVSYAALFILVATAALFLVFSLNAAEF